MPARLILIIALLSATTYAQYRFDHWTADDGLPQNSIYAIIQTRDGYLWMATLDGLVRFDGVRFTVFNKSNSPGIRNNRFTSLYEDSAGDLWAGTESGTATRLHEGVFSSYGEAEGLPSASGLIGADADGGAVFLVPGFRTVHFENDRFLSFDWESNLAQTPKQISRKTRSVYCSPSPEAKAVECIVGGKRISFGDNAGQFAGKILAAAEDVDGSLWILTDRRQALHVTEANGIRALTPTAGLPKFPANFSFGNGLDLISRDEAGSLWKTDLHTMQSELLLTKSIAGPRRTGDLFISNEQLENPISVSYEDTEGNLWLGTRRDGLFRARKRIVTPYSTAEGLSDNNIYAVFHDNQEGKLWIGSNDSFFSFEDRRFTQVKSPRLTASAIGRTPNGELVIASAGILYRREGDRFLPFLEGEIPKFDIYAIHSDRDGTLWVGSTGGLIRYKEKRTTLFTTAEGLAGNDVKVVIDAKRGGIWIGSYGGLSHFQDGRLTSWNEGKGLASTTIRSLYEDADGVLWIGSYDGGLARFKDGNFTHYTTKVGLFNDGVFQILEDESRNLWMSSNRGIYRVNRDELNGFADGTRRTITSIAYGKSDGMLNIECNGGRSPAGTKTKDGRLWFPTQDGLAVIDSRAVPINEKPPPVIIEGLKIDNNSVDAAAMLSAAADSKAAIRIQPDQQNFEINYTALSFINSENIRFKYRLEGLDEDWIEAGTRRTAYYSSIPPGEYRFHIIAANSDGVWNTQGRSLWINVLPPFYRTWTFGIAASMAALVGVFIIYRRRISYLKRAKQSQEDLSRRLIELQETERKRLAGDLHDSLSQNLVIIKNRAMLSLAERKNVDFAFEQIEEIAEAASESLVEVREIAGNLRPFQIDRLGLTKAIEALVRKANSAQLVMEANLDNIDSLLTAEMEINLYRILQESLNNIIKHSGATNAKLEIVRSGTVIHVRIRDNGKGFDRTQVKREGGFGLTGMNERARIMGSPLVVDSSPGHGTSVQLRIVY